MNPTAIDIRARLRNTLINMVTNMDDADLDRLAEDFNLFGYCSIELTLSTCDFPDAVNKVSFHGDDV